RTCGRAVVGVPIAGALPAAILDLCLHVNLSPERAARALPRRHGNAYSGRVGGGLRESRGRAIGRIGGAWAGRADRQRSALLGSLSADLNGLGLSLPHGVWGRHLVAEDEFWLVSTRAPAIAVTVGTSGVSRAGRCPLGRGRVNG